MHGVVAPHDQHLPASAQGLAFERSMLLYETAMRSMALDVWNAVPEQRVLGTRPTKIRPRA